MYRDMIEEADRARPFTLAEIDDLSRFVARIAQRERAKTTWYRERYAGGMFAAAAKGGRLVAT